jgi:hypothetical protein
MTQKYVALFYFVNMYIQKILLKYLRYFKYLKKITMKNIVHIALKMLLGFYTYYKNI